MKTRKSIFTTAALLVAAMAAGASADSFPFDSNGGLAGGQLSDVATFDWAPGNALSVGGGTATAAIRLDPTGVLGLDRTLVTLYQAKLSRFIDSGGLTLAPPPAGQEFTIVAYFQETVTAFIPGFGATVYDDLGPLNLDVKKGDTSFFAGNDTLTIGAMALAPIAGNVVNPIAPADLYSGWFEIYYDVSADADDLLGTGFNDGTIVARGLIGGTNGGVFSNFTVVDTVFAPSQPGQLDQFPNLASDDYPGLKSVYGSGSTVISGDIYDWNPDFFVFPVEQVTLSLANTNQFLPFTQADPSAAFVFAPNGAAPIIAGAGTWNGLTSTLGTINGADGTDVQFQADANQSFTVQLSPIPEPLTAGLGMMSLGALALASLRRRRA